MDRGIHWFDNGDGRTWNTTTARPRSISATMVRVGILGLLQSIHTQVEHAKRCHFDPVKSTIRSVTGQGQTSPPAPPRGLWNIAILPHSSLLTVTAIPTVCRTVSAALGINSWWTKYGAFSMNKVQWSQFHQQCPRRAISRVERVVITCVVALLFVVSSGRAIS